MRWVLVSSLNLSDVEKIIGLPNARTNMNKNTRAHKVFMYIKLSAFQSSSYPCILKYKCIGTSCAKCFFVIVYVCSRLDNLYFPLSPFLSSISFHIFPCLHICTSRSPDILYFLPRSVVYSSLCTQPIYVHVSVCSAHKLSKPNNKLNLT